jgi:hypothetical protein
VIEPMASALKLKTVVAACIERVTERTITIVERQNTSLVLMRVQVVGRTLHFESRLVGQFVALMLRKGPQVASRVTEWANVMELRIGLEVQCPQCGSWHCLVGATVVTTTAVKDFLYFECPTGGGRFFAGQVGDVVSRFPVREPT